MLLIFAQDEDWISDIFAKEYREVLLSCELESENVVDECPEVTGFALD